MAEDQILLCRDIVFFARFLRCFLSSSIHSIVHCICIVHSERSVFSLVSLLYKIMNNPKINNPTHPCHVDLYHAALEGGHPAPTPD